jgi:dGTPase
MGLMAMSIAEREAALLAPYAMASAASRGRAHPEPPHPYRGPFQRDRDRIIHSAAYRRLSYKTQVFTGDLGDYHRSRLTHTIEVSSIARTMGRALRLNEDLVEAMAVLHDIGHPPFGHAGEETLDELLAAEGGFDHNRQALRIVESLESRYLEFAGLNLSYEVLEGQRFRAKKDQADARPLLEAQVVDAADSVAYDAHDADDALQLGLLSLEELLETRLWREASQRVSRRPAASSAAPNQIRRAIVHELIDWQVGDLLQQAAQRLAKGGIDSPDAVRQADWILKPSDDVVPAKNELQALLWARVYRHSKVMDVRREAQDALAQLFDAYLKKPERMPGHFRRRIETDGAPRTVGDYVAGMTDRFALAQWRIVRGQ